MLGLFGSGLVVAAAVYAVAVAALLVEGRGREWSWSAALVACALGAVAGGSLSRLMLGQPLVRTLVWAVVVLAVVAGYGWWRRKQLFASAAALWSSLVVLGALGLAWGVSFLACLPVDETSKALLWAAAALPLLCLPSSLLTQREALEVLLRKHWLRQHEPLRGYGRTTAPFVSIQVPCHAEPPELVIETLDQLVRLDYPAFEVLVIDNNTTDPELWQPVQAHCDQLGERFRFAHVEGISGAKAGALNWARPLIDPRASLVAVVDADYHVDRRWLAATAGFLADPTVGFVQPPHAYRGWRSSRFGRSANYEYGVFFATSMVALQEHEAGITVGTMSVIRLAALDMAGGWAEWCQTEDSELAIRIHDLGYRSIYLREPLGWGLIPDTFAGYRQQRYRWTYGPVQELKRHWRRFLPSRCGGSTLLTPAQKLHHANHGLNVASVGLRLLSWPLALAAAASLVAHHAQIPVPFELWFAATVTLASGFVLRWLQYRRAGASPADAIGASLAYRALSHTITTAALSALVGREVPWRRTNKFRARQQRGAALTSVRTETILALVLVLAATTTITLASSGIATFIALGLAAQALSYTSAPLVALLAHRDLEHELDHLDRGPVPPTMQRTSNNGSATQPRPIADARPDR